MITAIATMSLAQYKYNRLNYTINVDYSLRMGKYILPAGKYVLHQVEERDLTLFALYKNDMTHSPIDMIQTSRIDYLSSEYPSKAGLIINMNESGPAAHPVLQGFNLPGLDGFEIIGVVARDNRVLTRVK